MIAIFGEAKGGLFHKLIPVYTLEGLADHLGEPTPTGLAIHMAIQALLSKQPLWFYKIREEGLDPKEYLAGLHLLKDSPFTALALPGVSDPTILTAAKALGVPMLLTEQDLYDLISSR